MTPKTTFKKTCLLAVLCSFLLTVSPGYADQVFGNFETGFDSWTIAWDGTDGLGTSTTGATLDDHSMTILPDDGDFWKLQHEGTLNLYGAARIAMDLTFVASEWPEGAWVNVNKIALQDHSTWNWQEVDLDHIAVEGISGAAPPDEDGNGNVAWWGPWLGDATWTVSWRLSDTTKSNDTYSLFMALQCNIDQSVAGYLYIDNVRVLSDDVAQPPSRLHVEDNKLVNEDGNEVTLRGVSLIDVGFLQDWQGGANNMVNRLTNATDTSCDSVGWNTNVIRIPVVPPADFDYAWPHPFDPNDTDLYDLLRSVVDYCALKSVYVIIDWHAIDDMNSVRIAEANEFWTYMAPLFADDTHVMFELFNEPIDNIGTDAENWAEVKAGMETLIDTVRTYAPDTVLFVGTPRWCQIIGPTADDPLDDPNVVYVAHIYPWHWINETLYYTTNIAAVAAVHPVIIGEWGFIEDGSDGTLDGTITNYGQPLKEFVEGLGIGNIAWVSSFEWQPPMYDPCDYDVNGVWTLLDGDGYMGCFVKDWLYDSWIADQNTSIPLTINRCVVKADKKRTRCRDSFDASGTFSSVPPNLLGVEQIDVNIVNASDGNVIYNEAVDGFAWDLNGNRFLWATRTKGQITLLILDFRNKRFLIKAKNINLTGLDAPLRLDFTLGDYMFSGQATETIINTTDPISVKLLCGYGNGLYTTQVKTTDSSKSAKDKLYAKGEIAVSDVNINLVEQEVVITWSDANEASVQTFTIPAGSFKKSRNKPRFKCRPALTTEGDRVSASIYLDSCTFKVKISKTDLSVTEGDVKFGITFDDFDETNDLSAVPVRRPSSRRRFEP